MKSHEVLCEAAQKIGVKALAAKLKLSQAMVYKWCQEPESADKGASGARNPLDRIAEILRLTGHAPIVSWLCHEAGGFFVENPRVRASDLDNDLLMSTQTMVQEFSTLLSEVSRSVADGNVSAAEAERIRGCWDKLKSVGETFVVASERGVYRSDARPPR